MASFSAATAPPEIYAISVPLPDSAERRSELRSGGAFKDSRRHPGNHCQRQLSVTLIAAAHHIVSLLHSRPAAHTRAEARSPANSIHIVQGTHYLSNRAYPATLPAAQFGYVLGTDDCLGLSDRLIVDRLISFWRVICLEARRRATRSALLDAGAGAAAAATSCSAEKARRARRAKRVVGCVEDLILRLRLLVQRCDVVSSLRVVDWRDQESRGEMLCLYSYREAACPTAPLAPVPYA